ncbi:MAG: pyridoxal 5'-phosphate synthase glutaminase subunit PdxT [Candidatus Dormibacteraeota bacterium]|nr:pyridoxal 5'-phosphate synthase glutaminase subunit PdxT [Candidatus Dormibacteraeota bacterium]
MPRIGVLALQGDVREHLAALADAGAEATTVRSAGELEAVDALVLPGGESTTMGRLLRVYDLEQPLRLRLDNGMPTLSTCAGLILLSREVIDGRSDQLMLGTLDVVTRRNAYGRQVDSFEADLDVEPLGVAPFRGVFIRAPQIEALGESVHVIAQLSGRPVAIEQGPHIGLAFHPEMTDDSRLHGYFVERVDESLQRSVA